MTDGEKRACERLYAAFGKARHINSENLRTLLSENKDTRFGREHGFEKIRSEEEYASSVPLSEYEDYEGKLSVCPADYTVYPVYATLGTSGSTGSRKLFPLTKEALNRYSSYVHSLPYALSGTEGKILHTSVFQSGKGEPQILSSAYFRWLHESGTVDFSDFAGGETLLFSDEIPDVAYVKSWLLIANPDLCAVQAIYLYDIAMLFSYLEEHWQMLLSDMRARRVSADIGEKEKAALLACIPTEERLFRAEAEFLRGFDTPILPRLWKNVRFVCGVGGKMYTVQEKQTERYVGNVPVYQFSYALSECIIGPALTFGEARYVLLPDSAYYEFLSKESESPVSLAEVRAGEEYELILSTFSGLYRYRTGDLLKIVGFREESPVFEIVGKRRMVLDIAGEKLSVFTVTEAVGEWAEERGLEAADFAVGIDFSKKPGGYCLFIEVDAVPAHSGAEDFDRILCAFAPDYEDLRTLGLLSAPTVRYLPRGAIAESRKTVGHSKPQIFLKPGRMAELLERSERYAGE